MPDPAALSLADRLDATSYGPEYPPSVELIREAATLVRSLQAELEDERQASQESYDERMAEIERLQAENERLSDERVHLFTEHGIHPNTPLQDILDYHDRCCQWKERLAATEAVAKRFRDVWRASFDVWVHPPHPKHVGPLVEPITDAEQQVLDRLNEPSPE